MTISSGFAASHRKRLSSDPAEIQAKIRRRDDQSIQTIQIPLKNHYRYMRMEQFLQLVIEEAFRINRITDPHIKANHLCRMWPYKSAEQLYFMRNFPVGEDWTIQTEEMYETLIQDIIRKYDG